MSELKYYKLCHSAITLTSPEFISVVEFGTGDEVYLKYEADKVIAEKDKKIDLYKRGFEENDKINAYLYAQLRHHKYKRCLAVARRCHNESLWWYSKGYGFEKYDKFWEKWENRWLELAEKFKEAKQ